jgi:ATP-dependent Clp protease ATP-binding subunit ClpA
MKANDFTIDDPPATSRWEAQSRLSTFYQLFYYPLQSFIAIKNALLKLSIVWWLPYIGSTLIIASILSGLKLFDYWFSSNTIHFQNNYKNLSESAQLKEIDAVIGRQNEINKVVNLLGILKSSSLTPLLIGKTGIGKSAIVKSLAKDIHDGKYPHLKNKQIIEINTSELHDQGSYNWGLYKSRLDILLKEIKGKEDKVILFLDEIHRIIKDPKDPDTFDLADRLKTILSEKKVNIIGATTIEEYNKHIKPFKALERRFEKIELDELSDNDHILALKTHVFNKFKDKTVENDAINLSLKLAKKNKDVATIANALIILDTCNNYLNTYKTLEENELSKLEDILKKLKNEYFLDKNKSIFSKETNIKINEIKKIEKKIKTLKERISKNNQSIKNLKDLQHKKNYYNQEFINYAHALKDLAFKDKNFSTIAKNFLFLSEYLLDVLNDLIKTKEDELNKKNIKTKIDVDLVEMLQLNSAQKKESRFYFLNFF